MSIQSKKLKREYETIDKIEISFKLFISSKIVVKSA